MPQTRLHDRAVASSSDPDLAIVEALCELFDPATREPLQFGNLVTGCQYLPLYRLTRRHARAGMTALDWGAGNGHFSYFLLRLGLDVTAFNLANQDCPLAPRLAAGFGDRFRLEVGPVDEPTGLPFADAAFDLVVSVGVLEHVRESGGTELASLTEIRRILKPGGRFVSAFLPRRCSWIEFLVRNLVPSHYHHLHRYTPAGLRGLVAAAGLDALELETHGFLPRNSLSAEVFAPFRDRRPVARLFDLVDRGLARALAPIAQNIMLCARKPAQSGSGPSQND